MVNRERRPEGGGPAKETLVVKFLSLSVRGAPGAGGLDDTCPVQYKRERRGR